METIGTTEMWSYFDGTPEAARATNKKVRQGPGHLVQGFLELATRVAELQFRNRDHVLLFRGQPSDHRDNHGNSSLKPTLFRPGGGLGGEPREHVLTQRFEHLKNAGRILAERYTSRGFLGKERLQRHRVLRWSILQHYGVCRTPLLDVTHSLRIAASFASLGLGNEAFVFVLGVPNISGAVTASAEAGIQMIRLASVCPPAALRPHIQEGYLLGEYPEMAEYEQKELYRHYEIDFGLRLVAKFRFEPHPFWKADHFPKVEEPDLYPNANDPLFEFTNEIKMLLGPET
jgi:FRG domain